jgi:SIR2-like domain
VARHCLAQNSVRFAIQQDRLIKRGRHTDLEAAVRQVLLRADQPLVLFLGAGASASANISTGDAIRDEALRDLVGPKPTIDELVEAFLAKLTDAQRLRPDERDLTLSQFRQRLTLERVLLEDFHRLAGRDPMLSAAIKRLTSEADTALEWFPEGRKALHHLVGRLPRLIVATINFDQLVEHGLADDHIVLARPEDFELHRQTVIDRIRDGGGPLPILKLHGTIEHVETLVATIAQTEFGLPREITETLDAMVAASDQALTWVWVGCSMRDVDLRIWLGNQDGARDLNEWWVDPLPSQALFDYARYLREGRWATLGNTLAERLITETADVFLKRLDEHALSLH